ncbi:MAG: hypothetical protein R2729_22820 [Bryobacteraceae bacterium]
MPVKSAPPRDNGRHATHPHRSPNLTALPFAERARAVEAHIANHHRIPVITRDIPDPLLGDLDGAEIHLDHLLEPHQRLFLLIHLFGHTVQWNTDPTAFDRGALQTPPVPNDRLPAILDYEAEAAAFGLALVHEIGIHDLDQWLSDYSACDRAYLEHFYRTAEKRPFESFWRDGTPIAPARAIPPFTPRRRTTRTAGRVI